MSLPKHIEAAIREYFPHMDGWCLEERACEMAERILETKAKVIVDIGVYAGRSTIAMGFAARELGQSVVYGIDPWKVDSAVEGDNVEANARWWRENSNLEHMHQRTMECIWAHRLDQWVVILRSPSQYVHQLFPQIDFLNLDGCHTEVASCRDVELYFPKLKQGAYATVDDCDWATVQPALKMIEKQCDLIKTMSGANEARTYRKH